MSNESPRGSLDWQNHIVRFTRWRERADRRHLVGITASHSILRVEWIDPNTGAATAGGQIAGDGRRTLNARGAGDAVLVLRAANSGR